MTDRPPLERTLLGCTTSAEFTTYSGSPASTEAAIVVGTAPLGPDVSRNNCNESATLRPIPDRLEGAPDFEDEWFALMVVARARRRLFGGDDERDGEMAGLRRERWEEVDEEEEDDNMDMGDAERGRGACVSLPRDPGEGNPGEETVDRGMSRGNVIARTTTGERELLFLASITP
jgi:hypothetical protein